MARVSAGAFPYDYYVSDLLGRPSWAHPSPRPPATGSPSSWLPSSKSKAKPVIDAARAQQEFLSFFRVWSSQGKNMRSKVEKESRLIKRIKACQGLDSGVRSCLWCYLADFQLERAMQPNLFFVALDEFEAGLRGGSDVNDNDAPSQCPPPSQHGRHSSSDTIASSSNSSSSSHHKEDGGSSHVAEAASSSHRGRGSVFLQVSNAIELDLPRTFPDMSRFQLEATRFHVRMVLRALAVVHPRTGYCQGMNFLAGALILQDLKTEDAFWVMHSMLSSEKYLLDYYDTTLRGSRRDMLIFQALIDKKHHKISKTFLRLGISVEMFSASWFLSLFLDTLPFEASIRFLDFYLLYGRRFLFSTAMAIIKLKKEDIKQCASMDDLLQILGKESIRAMPISIIIDTALDILYSDSDIKAVQRSVAKQLLGHGLATPTHRHSAGQAHGPSAAAPSSRSKTSAAFDPSAEESAADAQKELRFANTAAEAPHIPDEASFHPDGTQSARRS